jgi:flavin reductase (DIM6/NTAB) family NADH-FMN oxidoreductase RutF
MIRMQNIRTGEQLREAFGCFPSGVAAVCALVDGAPVGDQVIAPLEVRGLETARDTPPLIFHGSGFRKMAER